MTHIYVRISSTWKIEVPTLGQCCCWSDADVKHFILFEKRSLSGWILLSETEGLSSQCHISFSEYRVLKSYLVFFWSLHFCPMLSVFLIVFSFTYILFLFHMTALPVSMPVPALSIQPARPEKISGDSGDCWAFLPQCELNFELQATLLTRNQLKATSLDGSFSLEVSHQTSPIIMLTGDSHAEEITFFEYSSPSHPV